MPTRSALVVLFALLVFVPIGAAVYLGMAGLNRERGMLVEQERRAMESIADQVRDRLAIKLEDLFRTALARPPARMSDPREPVHDHFELRGDSVVWAGEGQVPRDITDLLQAQLPGDDSLWFYGDLAVRREPGGGVFRGFRVDPERVTQRYLDRDAPESLVRHLGKRFEYSRLVRERLAPAPDRFGLAHVHYRHVVPAERGAAPMLLPSGYLLELGIRPADALAEQVHATEENLAWTLGAVAVVVVLGLFFTWRALRAEARLAARKTEFVSAVSHELRTPLTSIRMYADMLKEGWVKDSDTAHDYFALISAESERLARLVNNVLDFSRIERGRKEFQMRLGDPAPVVHDVIEVLRPYLNERGFDLQVEVPDSLPECTFDKDALTQILVNLIDNAVKYGEKEVRIEADAKDGQVRLRVLDRGPGVAPDERERIFAPFARGRAAESGGGSGLGLALVRHYIDAHGGRIEVADRTGGGAVFAFHLPAA